MKIKTPLLTSFACATCLALMSAPSYATTKDGTFSGQAVGVWGNPVIATVQVKKGKIASIDVKHQETPALGGDAIEKLKKHVIKKQSLDVDAISGASLSSKAFLAAVGSALKQAGFVNAKSSTKAGSKNALAKAYKNTKTEVVVVGAGPSGMTAAIKLTKLGKKVILLEKLGVVGGNGSSVSTSYKAGDCVVQLAQKTPGSSIADFEKYLAGHKGATPGMSKLVAEESRHVVDFLVANGAELGKVSKTFSMGPKDGSAPGNQITPAFLKGLNDLKVDYRLENPVSELIMEKGRVVGVKVKPVNGKPYTIRAKAVILATGGYAANKKMLQKYAPEIAMLGTTNTQATQGDGYVMAEKAGAKLVNMKGISINPATYNTGHAHLSFTPIRYQSIMVNKDGKRFIDGNINDKNVVTQAMLKASGGTGHAYLIFDQNVLDKLGVAKEYYQKGYIKSAPTLPELAKELGVNPVNLEKTVTDFRGYVKTGVDPEFHQKRFECAFASTPYYGVQVEPSVHAIKGGIEVDLNGRALDNNGKPIPGLFAVGQVTEGQLGLHNTFVFGGPALALRTAKYLKETLK